MYQTPILLLVFNRPEATQQVFDQIKALRPKYLYVSADGPRAHRPTDGERCAATRAIFEQIDWECELKTLYREQNLGCRDAVSGGISWFFEQEEEGIILEDDCVPHLSFFAYCAELLERYRDDRRVMHICGSCLIEPQVRKMKESYFFSKYVPFIGWASWRRAWQLMDVELRELDDFKAQRTIEGFVQVRAAQAYMIDKFEQVRAGKLNSWGYGWHYSVLRHGGFCILPTVNLVQNIGFGADATHTSNDAERFSKPARAMGFPMRHPKQVANSRRIDQELFYATQKAWWMLHLRRVLPEEMLAIGRKWLGMKG